MHTLLDICQVFTVSRPLSPTTSLWAILLVVLAVMEKSKVVTCKELKWILQTMSHWTISASHAIVFVLLAYLLTVGRLCIGKWT